MIIVEEKKELLSRDYADFVCDGTNDTEILQKAINMYPNENVLILCLKTNMFLSLFQEMEQIKTIYMFKY